MVVPDEDDADGADLAPVDAAVGMLGWREVGGLEDEAAAPIEGDGELAGAITLQGVGLARDELGDGGRGLEVGQACAELAGPFSAELLGHLPL
jgi:hypothetical protein